jgi:hypothetical protein
MRFPSALCIISLLSLVLGAPVPDDRKPGNIVHVRDMPHNLPTDAFSHQEDIANKYHDTMTGIVNMDPPVKVQKFSVREPKTAGLVKPARHHRKPKERCEIARNLSSRCSSSHGSLFLVEAKGHPGTTPATIPATEEKKEEAHIEEGGEGERDKQKEMELERELEKQKERTPTPEPEQKT